MQPPSKQQIIQNRNRLRTRAKLFIGNIGNQNIPPTIPLNLDHKNSQEETIVMKIQSKKRKISQDISIFQSRHKTRQINLTSNFNQLFDIFQKLGQGAQSAVKKCKQKSTGNIYAVKIFRSDTELIENLKIQYKILKTLSNENIIQAHYLFVNTKQNSSHMVLQYSQFSSLRQCLNQQVILSQDEASAIINKLLIAVTYMHSKGICHRDIKPQNLLYNRENGNIKLIDFEIAKVCKNKFLRMDMWTKTGTVQYCAPQMFSGSYTQIVDVWAIGVMTYQMICGRYPFQIQYVKDAPQILQTQPYFPQSMSNFARDFIKRCLTNNPLKRATAKQCLTSPFLLVGSNHSPTPPSDKLNHSFDDCSTWSNAESFKESMKFVEQTQQFIGDDIGIRCFSEYFYQ